MQQIVLKSFTGISNDGIIMQSSSNGFYEMKVFRLIHISRMPSVSFIQVNRSSAKTFEREIVLEK